MDPIEAKKIEMELQAARRARGESERLRAEQAQLERDKELFAAQRRQLESDRELLRFAESEKSEPSTLQNSLASTQAPAQVPEFSAPAAVSNADEATKECPDCAELIKIRALVCRWCGWEADGTPSDRRTSSGRQSVARQAPRKRGKVPKRRSTVTRSSGSRRKSSSSGRHLAARPKRRGSPKVRRTKSSPSKVPTGAILGVVGTLLALTLLLVVSSGSGGGTLGGSARADRIERRAREWTEREIRPLVDQAALAGAEIDKGGVSEIFDSQLSLERRRSALYEDILDAIARRPEPERQTLRTALSQSWSRTKYLADAAGADRGFSDAMRVVDHRAKALRLSDQVMREAQGRARRR